MLDAPSDPKGYTVASYPFDLDTADIILRTSDQVDFRIHRAILAIVSPVFATMFGLPQPGGSQGNEPGPTSLPMVDISEDSKTLDTLLRLCYPVPKEETKETDIVILALNAAIKYDMEWPISIFTKKLEDIAFRKPLHTWTVACRLGSETVARKAATFLLRDKKRAAHRGLHAVLGADGWTALEGVSAGNYHRLNEFLRLQGAVDAEFLLLSPTFREPAETETCAERQEPQTHFISNIPNPDVICRSSDGVDFKVHQAILSLRSISFVKMPTSEDPQESEVVPTPHPPDGQEREQSTSNTEASSGMHRILHFDGDAQTLSIILAICYDSAPSSLDPSHLAKVITACDQYETGLKTVRRAVQRLWDEQARVQPLLAYFAAISHRIVPQARDSAKLAVSHNSLEGLRKYAHIMEDIPAHAYHKLVTYCLSCEHVIEQQLKKARDAWIGSDAYDEHELHYNPSKKGGSFNHISEQSWLVEYLEKVQGQWDAKVQGVDWTSLVGSFALVQKGATRSAFCPRSRLILRSLLEIGSTLPQKLAKAFNEASTPL